HSYTVVHRTPNAEFAEMTPYVFALVDLDEGVRITVSLVDVDEREFHCGDRVRIVFTPVADDLVLPCATVDDERADASP
ncbi:MAG: Zn-ribbon domain-containing OB-fold protein, partial [Luteibacter jiangsuensis]